MSETNPYTTPDAALASGQDELYQPAVFSFRGRIGRLRYLAYSIGITFLLLVLVSFIGALAGYGNLAAGGDGVGTIGAILMVLAYIPVTILSFGYGKRRLNDLNRSGWWFALIIIPLLNLLLSIYLIFFPGTDGSNNFGPAPAANSVGVLILAWMIPVIALTGILAAILIPQFADTATLGQ